MGRLIFFGLIHNESVGVGQYGVGLGVVFEQRAIA